MLKLREIVELLREINERLKRIEEAQKAVTRKGRNGNYIATGQ